MSNEDKNGLKEFKTVIADFGNLSSLAVKGVILTPMVDLVLKLGPPWPSGIDFIASIAQLLALIYIFHFWYSLKKARVNARMRVALALAFLGFVGYFLLVSTFTFRTVTEDRRVTIGFVRTEEGEKLFNKQLPAPPDSDGPAWIPPYYTQTTVAAYQEAAKMGPNPEELIWTPWSITLVRLGLLLSWVLLFVSIAIFIGAFIIVQRRRAGLQRAA
jgi:hypothetical protein